MPAAIESGGKRFVMRAAMERAVGHEDPSSEMQP
jgi:hypothetical protein